MMRRLIQELSYEKPLAAGRFTFFENGVSTGAVEVWQLNAAQDGYRFLRVDLNASASSGDNVLYHLVLDGEGRPQRLKFHFFREDATVRGDVLFSDSAAVLSREMHGQRLESEEAFSEKGPFWFPSCAGLSLLARARGGDALTLRKDEGFAFWPVTLALEEVAVETVKIMGRDTQTRVLHAQWDDQERVVWLDEHDWPVQVQRRKLTAIEGRYVRYVG